MAIFGLMVLGQAIYHLIISEAPDFRLMGIMGALALAANGSCLFLLTRHRSDDLNMRSTWLCSRNDIIANSGVLVAAALVFLFDSKWPDIILGLLITAVFMQSAVYVLRRAISELRKGETQRQMPVLLQVSGANCQAEMCAADSCRCGAAAVTVFHTPHTPR